jgi:hypothetical protein
VLGGRRTAQVTSLLASASLASSSSGTSSSISGKSCRSSSRMCASSSAPAAANASRSTMPAATAISSLRANPSSCRWWTRAWRREQAATGRIGGTAGRALLPHPEGGHALRSGRTPRTPSPPPAEPKHLRPRQQGAAAVPARVHRDGRARAGSGRGGASFHDSRYSVVPAVLGSVQIGAWSRRLAAQATRRPGLEDLLARLAERLPAASDARSRSAIRSSTTVRACSRCLLIRTAMRLPPRGK